jgi:hypothetical protein
MPYKKKKKNKKKKREELTEGCRKCRIEELHNFNPYRMTFGARKSKRLRWAGHIRRISRKP